MKKDDVVSCLIILGIGATIGAFTGLGLSFTALSPLVMGGIIAAVPITLCFVLCMLNEGVSKEKLFLSICFSAASAAIGVGLAAAATTIFPGAALGMGSAALAGAAIGVIAPIATFCAAAATKFAAEKVSEYIISPIVEKVGKCFSSKEEENGLVKG